jgi:hypothetical protein
MLRMVTQKRVLRGCPQLHQATLSCRLFVHPLHLVCTSDSERDMYVLTHGATYPVSVPFKCQHHPPVPFNSHVLSCTRHEACATAGPDGMDPCDEHFSWLATDGSTVAPFSREPADIVSLALAFDMCVTGEALEHCQRAGVHSTVIACTQVRCLSRKCFSASAPPASKAVTKVGGLHDAVHDLSPFAKAVALLFMCSHQYLRALVRVSSAGGDRLPSLSLLKFRRFC